jgi:excisionase family DNA binding protein
LSSRVRTSGERKKVDPARTPAADALGREQPPQSKPLPKATRPKPESPVWIQTGRGIPVLTVAEAARRLSMPRGDLEAMIQRGEIQSLPVGPWGMVVVPSAEVERMTSGDYS